MFPRPGTARWSSSAALTGARRFARRSASAAAVNPALSGSVGAHVVACVDFGDYVVMHDAITALPPADDPDGMVDGIVLRPPTGSEVERSEPDACRRDARDVALRGHPDLAHDR